MSILILKKVKKAFNLDVRKISRTFERFKGFFFYWVKEPSATIVEISMNLWIPQLAWILGAGYHDILTQPQSLDTYAKIELDDLFDRLAETLHW
jgi:hypothetical protein